MLMLSFLNPNNFCYPKWKLYACGRVQHWALKDQCEFPFSFHAPSAPVTSVQVPPIRISRAEIAIIIQVIFFSSLKELVTFPSKCQHFGPLLLWRFSFPRAVWIQSCGLEEKTALKTVVWLLYLVEESKCRSATWFIKICNALWYLKTKQESCLKSCLGMWLSNSHHLCRCHQVSDTRQIYRSEEVF